MTNAGLRDKVIEKDFNRMNNMQLRAVTATDGPVLVLAGAGSGKTTVLVNRIACLVKYGDAYNSTFVPQISDEEFKMGQDFLNDTNLPLPERAFSVYPANPWDILAITFTNKAANELKNRIIAKLGDKGNDIWAGTFHSICARILRRYGDLIGYSSHFTIYDTDDQKRVVKDILKQQGINEKELPPKYILNEISRVKDNLITPEEYKLEANKGFYPMKKSVAEVFALYQKRLKEADAMDFDDIITNTVALFNEHPDVLDYYANKFKYIMVDEYQDTNHAQYKLVSLLASVHQNICVVGDDDQSIYSFRGATIENILTFEDNYLTAKVIRLEQNYRSTATILDAANAVIANNKGRKGKNLWTNLKDDSKITVNTLPTEQDEARYVAETILSRVQKGEKFNNSAILYRMNALSSTIENVFVRAGIPYRVVGGHRFFDRKEIKDVIAYLNVINNPNDSVRLKRIINEPTAAALAYSIDKEDDQKVMVYDLGGGTFDVSIIEMGDGVQEVLATAGNNRLGGDDFDKRVMDYIVAAFKAEQGIDLSNDKMAMQRIKEAAEKAKIDLSGMTSTDINLPFITADATGPKHFETTLTRAKFNELTGDLVEATMGPVRQALADSGLDKSEINKVLMVGGSSRIPAVQDAVKNFIGSEPFKGINPDECVALGAAIQGGVLGGDVKGLLLLDVTPLSLGIETMGGVSTKVIDRNTTIPTKKSQIFSTAADGQTSVEVHVLQGEREFAKDNKTLGIFKLDGIAPAPRGIPQIEVTFDIDANGIVNVSAKDLGTGKEQKITITSNTNMSKDDIDKAVKEAEEYAAEDKKRRENVDVRNNADQMIYQTEKALGELGDKVSEEEKTEIQNAVNDLREALKGTDLEAIKAKQEALQQKFYAISEKLYKEAAAQAQANDGANAGNNANTDPNVYEADFKDATDDNK